MTNEQISYEITELKRGNIAGYDIELIVDRINALENDLQRLEKHINYLERELDSRTT